MVNSCRVSSNRHKKTINRPKWIYSTDKSPTRQRCIHKPVAGNEPIIILSPEFGWPEITFRTIMSSSASEIVANPLLDSARPSSLRLRNRVASLMPMISAIRQYAKPKEIWEQSGRANTIQFNLELAYWCLLFSSVQHCEPNEMAS